MSNPVQNSTVERSPIVVVLGHVDHGKSTLLDYLRESNTVEGEAGGITQHVAAYVVEHKNEHGTDKRITFLDTPGHEAFGAMRSRSARVADIAILIVSAEDGVREQTKEALVAITKEEIPYVVAINKIDKPNANVEKTIASLGESEVFLEGRGGNVPYAAISAKTGEGIDELLELLLLVAELEELKGTIGKSAEGFVIESHRDPKKGISATLLITDGLLSQGMHVATKESTAPTRILEDFAEQPIKEAGPSTPVQVVGWSAPPVVGSEFKSFATKKDAERFVEHSDTKPDIAPAPLLEDTDEETDILYVPIIIKTDVVGSIDALQHEIDKLTDEKTNIKVLRADVGAVSEGDVKTAGGDSRTLILGFNTRVESGVQELAEKDGITVQTFTIIYELAKWLQGEIAERKPKEKEELLTASATILKLFSQTKKVQVVGGTVDTGTLRVGNTVEILRREEAIGTGTIKELQSQKASVKEVSEGNECGMKIETSVTLARKDTLQAVSA